MAAAFLQRERGSAAAEGAVAAGESGAGVLVVEHEVGEVGQGLPGTA